MGSAVREAAMRSVMAPLVSLMLVSSLPATTRAQDAAPYPPPITRVQGQPIAFFTVSDRAGKPVHLSDYRGRIVIVNLWATWCPPCRAEMPSLERLAARYPKDLVVLAVSNDTTGWPAIDRFWGDRFPHVRVALAPGPDLAGRLGALGLPYSLVVDRDGREIARFPRGGEWDQGPLAALVAQNISQKTK